MDTIWCIVYCQGFCISNHQFSVREMALCDLSSHHRAVYSYDLSPCMPMYQKLTPGDKKVVDKAISSHGVAYEPKYSTCNALTDDFDTFVAKFGPENDEKTFGVWGGDEVAFTFLTGLGVPITLIEHDELFLQPLGCVLSDEEQWRNPNCAGHGFRKYSDEELDEDAITMNHTCSLHYACALASYVRAQTHYRSPTLIEDLNEQRGLWQARCEHLLNWMLCDNCVVEMTRAFERGEGITWNDTNCDGRCKTVGRIFQQGVHTPWNACYHASSYKDGDIDNLCVFTPFDGTMSFSFK